MVNGDGGFVERIISAKHIQACEMSHIDWVEGIEPIPT